MKSQTKIRRLIGVIIVGVLLFTGARLSDVEAQTELASAERAMSDRELFREIERLEASMPPFQVWNLSSREVKEAKLNWAIAEMGNAVSALLRGEEINPIPANAVHIVQSQAGFGVVDDFRLALTLLESETGLPMGQLLPATATGVIGPATVREQGWGGFAEYGAFAVIGFVFLMWVNGWTSMSLKPPMEEEEEEFEAYQKAA